MYLDVLFTVCLYYARSFFQKEASEMNRLPTSDDISGNCKIQLASVELLTLLCTELITIVKDMGKRLACYIFDLMAKCKLQKVLLRGISNVKKFLLIIFCLDNSALHSFVRPLFPVQNRFDLYRTNTCLQRAQRRTTTRRVTANPITEASYERDKARIRSDQSQGR